MTTTSPDERFRAFAMEEAGMPISAGARIGHVIHSLGNGRTYQIDLSGVPDDDRPTVVNEIAELVRKATTRATSDSHLPTAG
jgi:hypothetical protein